MEHSKKIIDPSGRTLIEGVDFYYGDAGFFIFTEKYHLDKGFCCGNGCLHCPYDFKNVPEPERSRLLHLRSATRS